MNRYNGLTMSFPVDELKQRLKTNMKEHSNIIAEANKNYLTALGNELRKKLELLEAGKEISPHSKLPIPGDNLDEYSTAISMLGFTSDTTVVLTQDQYHCYVEDKWSWQEDFLNTAANYSVLANTKLAE